MTVEFEVASFIITAHHRSLFFSKLLNLHFLFFGWGRVNGGTYRQSVLLFD